MLLRTVCQVNFRGENQKLTLVSEELGFWTVLREVIKQIWQETEIGGSNCGKRARQLENRAQRVLEPPKNEKWLHNCA